LAEEYRAEAKMEAEPFTFVADKPTILKRSELESLFKQFGGRKVKKDKAKKEKKKGKPEEKKK
jgi:hypothetical protein